VLRAVLKTRTVLTLVGWFRNVALYFESPPALEIRSLTFFSLGCGRLAFTISCIAIGRMKTRNSLLSFATTFGFIHVLSCKSKKIVFNETHRVIRIG
jgi:hypothetical protein